jgi:hypothetical protein
MSNRADNPGWKKDGNVRFGGGQDQGRSANDIDRNQVALAVNCTMRGDRIKPRPAYIKRVLSYGNDLNLALAFQRGRFQVAGFYDGNGYPALLSSHSGRQFRIDLNSFEVSEITPLALSSVLTTGTFFVMPSAGANVVIPVTDTSTMLMDLPSITVGGYPMTLISIDSTTQITARNNSGVTAPTITANLVLSATLGYTSTVTVSSTTAFGGPLKTITIGGKTLSLVSVGVGSITVSNVIAAQAGITIASGASITIPDSGNPVGEHVAAPATVQFSVYNTNSPDVPLNWQLQAEKYWILQDSKNAAIIYDGSSSRRSNPNLNEIPVGNVMEYAMGRIAVALPDRRTYRVGDIVFGSSGTANNGYIDAILKLRRTTTPMKVAISSLACSVPPAIPATSWP